jgi:hypothetical protein
MADTNIIQLYFNFIIWFYYILENECSQIYFKNKLYKAPTNNEVSTSM